MKSTTTASDLTPDAAEGQDLTESSTTEVRGCVC